tara:strand:- start:3446 stop:3862 length:417 start_codon:yes stop_codon:yes gene_type:complete
MVWNQYIYEANVGYDTENNSEDETEETFDEYTGEDWKDDFPDDIRFMWNSICTLLYDAHIEHSGNLCDFVEFCNYMHDDIPSTTWDNEQQTEWYEERLEHVWDFLCDFIRRRGLSNKILTNASFNNFVDYAKNIMCIY